MSKRPAAVLLHTFLWILSFIVLHRIFTVDYDGGISDVIYTLLFHIPVWAVVYINLFFLKGFFRKTRWLILVVWFSLIFIGIGLHQLVFGLLADFLAPGYYFITYYTNQEIGLFMTTYLVASTLVAWSAQQFQLQDEKAKLEREHQAEKLRNLKAQINPHFLINSLNNIYAMTEQTDQKTRDYLVRLSDALRYMVYDTDARVVLLEKEMSYIENYIALEKLRLEDNTRVFFKTEGDFEGFLIAPLILIPCVENCFKHFDKSAGEIYIHVYMSGAQLEMRTKNNFDQSEIIEPGGLGLENLRIRLNLLYPQKYSFDTWSETPYFHSLMKIDLS